MAWSMTADLFCSVAAVVLVFHVYSHTPASCCVLYARVPWLDVLCPLCFLCSLRSEHSSCDRIVKLCPPQLNAATYPTLCQLARLRSENNCCGLLLCLTHGCLGMKP